MKQLGTRFIAATLLSTAMAASTQAGGSIDMSLANETARFAYDATQVGSGLHISAAIQHDREDGNLLSAGMHVVDVRETKRNLYIGVGGKLFGYFTDDYDGAAIGVGGFFRYNIPGVKDVSVAGYGYYAPPVTTFGDAEHLWDTDLRLQFAVIPTARIYTGYRYSAVKVEDVKKRVKLADGLHFGIKIDF